jgi:hypothetical protein
MYLVTSPDNVLVGARETLREARELVTKHALSRKNRKDLTDADLREIADPARWNLLLSRYRVERVSQVALDRS